MRYKITLILLGLLPFALRAQHHDHNSKSDKIESYKIAFITERLDLSPKEAAAFWPVYNEYNAKVKQFKEQQRELAKSFKQLKAPTEADADKYISTYMAIRNKEAELSKKYIGEFKKVLPVTKVAMLITIEQDFKMKLLNQLKTPKEQ